MRKFRDWGPLVPAALLLALVSAEASAQCPCGQCPLNGGGAPMTYYGGPSGYAPAPSWPGAGYGYGQPAPGYYASYGGCTGGYGGSAYRYAPPAGYSYGYAPRPGVFDSYGGYVTPPPQMPRFEVGAQIGGYDRPFGYSVGASGSR